jgi:hypothetical protein
MKIDKTINAGAIAAKHQAPVTLVSSRKARNWGMIYS